jgi:hypothetical protein
MDPSAAFATGNEKFDRLREKKADLIADMANNMDKRAGPKATMEAIMGKQGMHLNPTTFKTSTNTILPVIVKELNRQKQIEISNLGQLAPYQYDVFLSYRVFSDSKTVENFYHFLTSQRITVFMDCYRLVEGDPWKDGFMKGLGSSRIFLFMASSGGLAPLRDKYKSLKYDNFLLEADTALRIDELVKSDWDPETRFMFPIMISSNVSVPYYEFSGYTATMEPTAYYTNIRPFVMAFRATHLWCRTHPAATLCLIGLGWMFIAATLAGCRDSRTCCTTDAQYAAMDGASTALWVLFAAFVLIAFPVVFCVKCWTPSRPAIAG